MAAKFIVLLCAAGLCNALPPWFTRPIIPSIAFGFGSGITANIGGIRHSSGIGAAFSSGNGYAYGRGGGNNELAHGIGLAEAAPTFQQPPLIFYHGNGYNKPLSLDHTIGEIVSRAQSRDGYGSAVSAIQHGGKGHFAAVSSSQNGFGSAVSSVISNGLGYENAVSSANTNIHGHGAAASSANSNGRSYESAATNSNSNGGDYGSVVAAAHNIGGYKSATSLVQGNYGSSIASSQHFGDHHINFAQSSQHRGNSFRDSGANSINVPGLQTVQSHAVSSGYF